MESHTHSQALEPQMGKAGGRGRSGKAESQLTGELEAIYARSGHRRERGGKESVRTDAAASRSRHGWEEREARGRGWRACGNGWEGV